MPSLLAQKPPGRLRDVAVELFTHSHERPSDVVVQIVDVADKLFRHRLERVHGPRPKPVDRAAVHEARELLQTLPERFPDRGRAEAHVREVLAPPREEPPELERGFKPGGVPRGSYGFDQRGALVRGEHARHLPGVQKVVHVLHERLGLYLRVREEEDDVLARAAGGSEHLFQVFPPLRDAVRFRDLHALQSHTAHVRGQTRERLPPGTADADEEQRPAGLPQHARDPRHVLGGVQKHREVHRRRRRRVVRVEVPLQGLHERVHVRDLRVRAATTRRRDDDRVVVLDAAVLVAAAVVVVVVVGRRSAHVIAEDAPSHVVRVDRRRARLAQARHEVVETHPERLARDVFHPR